MKTLSQNEYFKQGIDWISFTLPIEAERAWPDGLESVATETKSFNGYDTAFEYEDGRIELTSSHRPEMGRHCVLSGKTCSNLRDRLPEILERCWFLGGRVTRIDFALDDYTGRIHPRDAQTYINTEGGCICRAKEYPVNQDARGGGFTQYLGKMASEVHVCLYEKDAEQGISGFRIRCEIRYKHKRADKAAKAYLRDGDCRGLVRSFVQFPQWDEWNRIFATKPTEMSVEKVASRRVQWLLGQVSKSIALEISERGGDLEILELIRESVFSHLSDFRQAQDEK